MEREAPSWRTLPAPTRVLAYWLTIVQVVGYTTSLIYVWWTTRLTPAGIVGHYRGVDPSAGEGDMHFPKSFAEMLTLTHTHLLSMAAIFALSGVCLALSSGVRASWRTFLIAEPFVALLVSFAAMWLMRYADPRFAWLLEASSAVMALTFYEQSWLIFRELSREVHLEGGAA